MWKTDGRMDIECIRKNYLTDLGLLQCSRMWKVGALVASTVQQASSVMTFSIYNTEGHNQQSHKNISTSERKMGNLRDTEK